MTGPRPVPVVVVTSQFEAELIVGLLQNNGVDAAAARRILAESQATER